MCLTVYALAKIPFVVKNSWETFKQLSKSREVTVIRTLRKKRCDLILGANSFNAMVACFFLSQAESLAIYCSSLEKLLF